MFHQSGDIRAVSGRASIAGHTPRWSGPGGVNNKQARYRCEELVTVDIAADQEQIPIPTEEPKQRPNKMRQQISPNMSDGYSRSCYLHNYQLQNLGGQAQISGRNTLFTDETPQMPFHIHPRNLGSYSTPPAFPMCLLHPFQLPLNNLGASYHLHPSGST